MKNITSHGWMIIRPDMCTEMEFGNLTLYNVHWIYGSHNQELYVRNYTI